MPLRIEHNQIITMPVDVIVDAGSPMEGLVPGEVVSKEPSESSVKAIFYTKGPTWMGGDGHEAAVLSACYLNALNLAVGLELESIAFPLISSNDSGFPEGMAIEVAISTIGEFLLVHELDVYLVISDKAAFHLPEHLNLEIEAYIGDHYEVVVSEESVDFKAFLDQDEELLDSKSIGLRDVSMRSLEEVVNNLGESFSEMLLRLIDERGLTDPYVYKRANVTKQTFWKIRNKPDYSPKKTTAVALAIALELSLDETKDLLRKAGYALSNSSLFDVIITFFIERESYNIFEINEVLFKYDVDLLGV